MKQEYSDIANYFQDLAQKHKEIKEFKRYELDELLSNAMFTSYPALVLEGFDFDFSGSSPDNVLKNRTGGFNIVLPCNINNAEERTQTLDHLETIGDQFIMKIAKDKKERHPLLTAFDLSSIEGIHFANPAHGIVFCRYTFTLRTKIVEDLSVWE